MTREHTQGYTLPTDPYAAHRCGCGHIVYADDQPGERCRWNYVGAGCGCTDHRVAGGEAA